MDQIDLSLIPMENIIKELDKRFDTVCLLTRKQIAAEEEDINYHFKDRLGCLGLIRIADAEIKNQYRGNESDKFSEDA